MQPLCNQEKEIQSNDRRWAKTASQLDEDGDDVVDIQSGDGGAKAQYC